jgi:hypothetical protein
MIMKRITSLLSVFALFVAFTACAQNQKPSPPASAEFKAGGANIKIKYSAPSVKGREIWGKLVPYGEVWRTGANEATTFETDKDIKVEGKTLPAGTYSLFTIPGKDEWVVVFNKTAKQWGAYSYKTADDVLRVTVKPTASEMTETLKIEGEETSGKVNIRWEKLTVPFKIS